MAPLLGEYSTLKGDVPDEESEDDILKDSIQSARLEEIGHSTEDSPYDEENVRVAQSE